MEVSSTAWGLLKDTIITKVLLTVGLSAINPMGKVVVYFTGKFLDKFIQPQYHLGVATGIKEWAEHEGKKKLKVMDDAIKKGDRGSVINIIDSLN